MASRDIDFLKRQFFKISWSASTQRNPTYQKSANPAERTRFMNEMGRYLIPIVDREYARKVSENRHYENLRALMDFGAQAGHDILVDGFFKSANAQKLLNVYLKFFWCAGRIPCPPHCPVDAIVLRAAGIPDKKWTTLHTLDEYCLIVDRLKITAGDLSLAEWELAIYEENA